MLLSILLSATPLLQPLLQETKAPISGPSLQDAESGPAYDQSAYDKAAKENRRVLVQVGIFDEAIQASQEKLLKERAVQRVLLYEYVKSPLPETLLAESDHQVAFRIFAADRTPLATITFADLRNAEGKLDSARLLDLLKKHQAEPWDAMELLEQARKQAVAENKRLMVNLGAPW